MSSAQRGIVRRAQRVSCQVQLNSGPCGKPAKSTKFNGYKVPMCKEHSQEFSTMPQSRQQRF